MFNPLFSLLFFLAFQQANAAQSLSWADCVELAKNNNAELKYAGYTLDSSANKQSASWNTFAPHISASLDYDRDDTPQTTYAASLSGTQNLFGGFGDIARIRQTRSDTKSAKAAFVTAKAKISYELKTAFSSLLYSKEYVKLSADIIKRRQENLKLVGLRFESGRENKGSVLLSKAYLESAKYDALQAGHAARVARAQLAKNIGLDETDNLDIVGEVPSSNLENNIPDFKSLAVSTPDFDEALARLESASAGITIARSNFLPSLDLTARTGKQGDSFFPQGERSWSVGLSLGIPLFDGGRDYFGTRAAVATWTASEFSRTNVVRGLLTKLEQSHAAFSEAQAKLEVDRSFREAALVRAQIARTKYNNGLLSFEDWDLIENDLIARQKAFLQSKRERTTTEAAWEQSQGKGVIQ